MEAGDWSGANPLQSTVSAVHTTMTHTAIHPVTTELP